jgi:hypothetical protein
VANAYEVDQELTDARLELAKRIRELIEATPTHDEILTLAEALAWAIAPNQSHGAGAKKSRPAVRRVA